MSSAKQNPGGPWILELLVLIRMLILVCMCVFFILIKTTVTVSVDWNMAEVFPFADLHAQADGRCFLSEKFRSGSSLNNPLFGVHKLATIYSS